VPVGLACPDLIVFLCLKAFQGFSVALT
jgi:hypothetical protein